MSITVGLDFDGVIGGLCSYQKGGAQYDEWREAIGLMRSPHARKPARGDQIVRSAFEEAHLNPDSPIYLRPMYGAVASIRRLLALGLSLHVVTARTVEDATLAFLWLTRQGLALPFHATHNEKTKRHALARIRAVAHVDDTPRVLADIQHDTPHRILFAPFASVECAHHVASDFHTVTSWLALEDRLLKLNCALTS